MQTFGLKENHRIQVAVTAEQKKSVYKLAYNVYLQKGFISENFEKEYKIPNDLNDKTRVLFIENEHKEILGTVTVLSNVFGRLPYQTTFLNESKILKDEYFRQIEFTRLVLCEKSRGKMQIIKCLMNFAYLYSYYFYQGDSIICEVNPRHEFFYNQILGFNKIGEEKSCSLVKGAPAVLMHARISDIRFVIYNSQVNSNILKNLNHHQISFYKSFCPFDCEENAFASYVKM
ncbi:MAG: hypothetical protein COA79_21855 [Planctomycetota bacterium]|nr:MAG: hypothetical protein COA79_21855 [Planctomycetota bacterium]